MSVWAEEWDDQAQADLVEAFHHYDAIGFDLSDSLIAEVDRLAKLIQQNPYLAAPYFAGTRRKNLDRFPYAIINRIYEDQRLIYIAVFMYVRRKPGYWLDR